jgi:O-antigen/teichoic acid export membrane protein
MAAEDSAANPPHATHLRGSSLLLAGRIIGVVLQTITHVLIVRILSQEEYGAFAYGLGLAATVTAMVGFGRREILTRFFTVDADERRYGRLVGTLVMEAVSVCLAGGFAFVALLGAHGLVARTLIDDPRAVTLLLILVLLAPLEALDGVFEALLAVFAKARTIAFRRYVLTPGLRLSAVIALLLLGPSAVVVAVGFVLTGLVGTAMYGVASFRLLRRRRIYEAARSEGLTMPFKEVWGFGLPIFYMQIVASALSAIVIVLLGRMGGAIEVAAFRAVYPPARLNQLVYFVFGLLFVPVASRLFARGDETGMRKAYWETAVWLSVLTFPVFACTVPLAGPTVAVMFGNEYSGSSLYLAVLGGAMYFNVIMGYNSLTLRVYGVMKHLLIVSTTGAVITIGVAIVLIPTLGALGGAIATAAGLVTSNLLNQLGLRSHAAIPAFETRYLRVYAVIASGAAFLAGVEAVLAPHPLMSIAAVLPVWIGVVLLTRTHMAIDQTFPEVLQVPLVRRLFAD